jgi:hypothetical protein
MNVGDVVQLTTNEGKLLKGAQGVVRGLFTHPSGDLLIVRFKGCTRVVHAGSLEAVPPQVSDPRG